MSSMCAYNWHIFLINRFLHTAFFAHAYTETSYLSDEKYTMSTKLVVGQRFEPLGIQIIKTLPLHDNHTELLLRILF